MIEEKNLIQKIKNLPYLSEYKIRELVADAKSLGETLHGSDVKTNQIRKFLDAVNRLKFDLAQGIAAKKIDIEVVMLKTKLVYAVARADKKQKVAIKQLGDVVSTAIDGIREVKSDDDLGMRIK